MSSNFKGFSNVEKSRRSNYKKYNFDYKVRLNMGYVNNNLYNGLIVNPIYPACVLRLTFISLTCDV